nr:translation initiation factor IF-2-like [Aegilops tauschii subsp. strangulata]
MAMGVKTNICVRLSLEAPNAADDPKLSICTTLAMPPATRPRACATSPLAAATRSSSSSQPCPPAARAIPALAVPRLRHPRPRRGPAALAHAIPAAPRPRPTAPPAAARRRAPAVPALQSAAATRARLRPRAPADTLRPRPRVRPRVPPLQSDAAPRARPQPHLRRAGASAVPVRTPSSPPATPRSSSPASSAPPCRAVSRARARCVLPAAFSQPVFSPAAAGVPPRRVLLSSRGCLVTVAKVFGFQKDVWGTMYSGKKQL